VHDKCELRSLLSILPATIPSHVIEKYLPTLGKLATVPRLPADVLPVPSWHIIEPLTIKDKCDADTCSTYERSGVDSMLSFFGCTCCRLHRGEIEQRSLPFVVDSGEPCNVHGREATNTFQWYISEVRYPIIWFRWMGSPDSD